MTSVEGTERATFPDSVARTLYRYRGWVPVLPILAALIWADPRRPWWVIGIGCMVVGEALRCWGAAHLGLAARSSRPLSHKLVTSGPFAHTRHPLYWGNACLTLGFVTATGAGWPWFPALSGLGFALLYGMHACREERALSVAFPAEYATYRASVPARRWRVRPARVAGAGESSRSSLARALHVELGSIHAELWLLILLWLRVRFL
jgi:protein-S-isoprenylcysteine O-methyltransferase Ste14